MPKFVFLLHEDPSQDDDLSPEEMQGIVEKYRAWSGRLGEAGHLIGGHKLTEDGGKVVSGRGSAISVTDGPYAEAKEVIGGLFQIEAADLDEAVALSRDCPHLDHGTRIEIRRVDLE